MKFLKYIVVNDFHIPYHDETAYQLFKEFLKEEKPNRLIIAGDLLDCAEISDFRKSQLSGDQLQKDLDLAFKMLKEIRTIVGKKCRIDYIEGNHEFRLKKYLMTRAPELLGLKSLKFENLLKLKELNIIFHSVREEANRFQDNYIQIENIFIGHFDTSRKGSGSTARGLLVDKGVSVIQAHNHRIAMIIKRELDNRLLIGIENACLCSLNPTYVAAPDWHLGWSIIFHNITNHRIYIYPILLGKNYEFFFGNCEYSL